jgi:hypothetical protein
MKQSVDGQDGKRQQQRERTEENYEKSQENNSMQQSPS